MNQTRNRRRCCDGRLRHPVRGALRRTPEDNIGRLVVSNFAEPKAVMNIVSAVAHAGRAAEVTAFGVEMQQVLTSTTGQPAAFVVGMSGVFGGTRFAVGADSMASLEEHERKLQADATFATLMAKGGDLFVPGTGQSVILRKIN